MSTIKDKLRHSIKCRRQGRTRASLYDNSREYLDALELTQRDMETFNTDQNCQKVLKNIRMVLSTGKVVYVSLVPLWFAGVEHGLIVETPHEELYDDIHGVLKPEYHELLLKILKGEEERQGFDKHINRPLAFVMIGSAVYFFKKWEDKHRIITLSGVVPSMLNRDSGLELLSIASKVDVVYLPEWEIDKKETGLKIGDKNISDDYDNVVITLYK
jgi:hypothetical protein